MSSSSLDEYVPYSKQDAVEDEKQKVIQLEREKIPSEGVRLMGIQKVYTKFPFGIKSQNDFQALKGVRTTQIII